MHAKCPNCSAKLKDFAFSCERCGWSLDSQLESAGTDKGPATEAASALSEQPTGDELHLEQASRLIEQEQYAAAIRQLNRGIVDAPAEKLGELYGLRGYSNLKLGEFATSEADCSLAIEKLWTRPQVYAWRAAARGEQAKWRSAFDDLAIACELSGEQSDQYLQLMESYAEAASEHFRSEIKAERDTADLFFERGWMYFRMGRFDRASRDFNFALQREPKHALAALGLASTRFESQLEDRDSLKQVIELCDLATTSSDPDVQLEALRIRAAANYSFGHYSRAARDLESLSRRCEGDAEKMIACATLRQKLELHIEAINDLSKVLELESGQHIALRLRADSYAAIRNYSLAIDDYSRFIRIYPDDILARVNRGEALLKTVRPDLALEDFDKVLTLDPSNVAAFLGRARIFIARKQLDLALTECEKAVRLDNSNHGTFVTLGEIYIGLCDYARAIEEFTHAIRLAAEDSQKAESLYRRGTAHYELNDFQAAHEDFTSSVELRPHHAGTWIWNSAACSRLENWPTAITSLQQAISSRPSLADRYLKLGRPVARKAVDYFRHQLQRGRDNASTYRSLGLAWHFLDEHELAIENYTRALELEPGSEETVMRRGQAHAAAGEHDKANDDFSIIIKRDSNHHEARFQRAAARAARKRNHGALTDVAKAIKVFPGDPVYHALHGDLLQRPDATSKAAVDWEKVIRAYDRALRIDSSDPETLRKRGNANVQMGNTLNAVNDFTRALELDPTRTDILMQRGHAFLKDQQHERALQDFELALTRDGKLARAYSGRAAALAAVGRHEYALIWLTKGMHRFSSARELAEILFARAKTFYQMRRFHPAINDFSSVLDLLRTDQRAQIPARIARAIAWTQIEHFKNASIDFQAVLDVSPVHLAARAGLAWLDDLGKPMPEMFASPEELIRPTKPAVSGDELEYEEIDEAWNARPPFDSWILRIRKSDDQGGAGEVREYGPVTRQTLEVWTSEGRIDIGMKLLRADWGKWEPAENVLPSLKKKMEQKNSFPGVQTRRRSSSSEEAATTTANENPSGG